MKVNLIKHYSSDIPSTFLINQLQFTLAEHMAMRLAISISLKQASCVCELGRKRDLEVYLSALVLPTFGHKDSCLTNNQTKIVKSPIFICQNTQTWDRFLALYQVRYTNNYIEKKPSCYVL